MTNSKAANDGSTQVLYHAQRTPIVTYPWKTEHRLLFRISNRLQYSTKQFSVNPEFCYAHKSLIVEIEAYSKIIKKSIYEKLFIVFDIDLQLPCPDYVL